MEASVNALPKAALITAAAIGLSVVLSSEAATATKKKPPTITQEQAKKICAKAYGLFYKAVVRNGQVICYI